MTATEIAMLASLAMQIGPQAYAFIMAISEGKFPTWDKLMSDNAALQAKIDAEK